jgi:hypothetical protein
MTALQFEALGDVPTYSGNDRLAGETGNDTLWAADFGTLNADGGPATTKSTASPATTASPLGTGSEKRRSQRRRRTNSRTVDIGDFVSNC